MLYFIHVVSSSVPTYRATPSTAEAEPFRSRPATARPASLRHASRSRNLIDGAPRYPSGWFNVTAQNL